MCKAEALQRQSVQIRNSTVPPLDLTGSRPRATIGSHMIRIIAGSVKKPVPGLHRATRHSNMRSSQHTQNVCHEDCAQGRVLCSRNTPSAALTWRAHAPHIVAAMTVFWPPYSPRRIVHKVHSKCARATGAENTVSTHEG